MMRPSLISILLLALSQVAAAQADPAGAEFFEKRIRPLLVSHCYECHSGQAKKIKGELRLDHRAGWSKGGVSGPALKPGKPDESLLIQAVRYADKDTQMPPKQKLPAEAIADLEKWVAMGAPGGDEAATGGNTGRLDLERARKFWSFQPLKAVEIPAVKDTRWPADVGAGGGAGTTRNAGTVKSGPHPSPLPEGEGAGVERARVRALLMARDIDHFILAKLEESNLRPAPPADPRTLIRRATFDLTGLPPTPEEVDAFVRACEEWEKEKGTKARRDEGTEGKSDDATKGSHPTPDTRHPTPGSPYTLNPTPYTLLLDRLLASPHYGERWGRHWLDVVRYADTAGETADYPVPHAWRYRNYVIDAFNSDKPYDQFLHEQIAGDILASRLPADADPKRYAELITATGYIAIARRFGFRIDKDHHLTLEDTVDTLGKSVLGLSIGCARCHDHKYDPVSMQDFYALYGIFESTRFPFPGCEHTQRPRDMLPLLTPRAMEQSIKPHQALLAAAEAEYQKAKGAFAAAQKKVKETAQKSQKTLAKSAFDNGGGDDFAAKQTQPDALSNVAVKKGSAIQIAVFPRGNFGGDSTLIELTITEIAGQKRTWSLAADLLADPQEVGNGVALRDSHGHAGVWCMLDLRSEASFLDRSVADAYKTPGLRIWKGAEDYPIVGAYRGEKTAAYLTTVTIPPRTIVLHPSNGGGVAIVWVSPIDGAVSVSGKAADLDKVAGGDGVAWSVDAFAQPELGAALMALRDAAPALVEPKRKRDELAASAPKADLAYAITEGAIADAKLLKRGDIEKPGDPVRRRMMELFGGQPVATDAGSGRLQLALSLTAPSASASAGANSAGGTGITENISAQGLTARVMVNRIWLHHFGAGLVRTPNDFGSRGELPTHPKLLEYLALEFVRSGWSIKTMHRAIMLSSAYQRGGEGIANSQSAIRDSQSFFPRRRLSAEEIRDSMLAVSGDLDREPGGAHPFPPDNTWGFTQHNPFAAVYDHNKRSVYLMVQRSRRHPFLSLFDGADANASTGQRQATTVPTQSLYFMNDPFVHARAANVAAKLLMLPDDSARLDRAYGLLYQRKPTDRERSLATDLLARYQAGLAAQPAGERGKVAWAALIRVLLSANEFVYVD